MNEPEAPSGPRSDLERRLAARSVPAPSPELRARVLAAIDAEFARGPARVRSRPWSFAAAAAAVALVWANLSLSAANVTRPLDSAGLRADDLHAEAARVRALFPELNEQDALRETLLARAGGRIVPLPRVESRRSVLPGLAKE